MARGKKRRNKLKEIETRLFNRKHYEAAIENLKLQLDYIMPNITANYSISEGGRGYFNISSSTEKAAIDRIESRAALNIHEDIERYKVILNCIDRAVASLSDDEQKFIQRRYYDEIPIIQLADEFDYSPPHLYRLKDQILRKLAIMLSAVLDL